MTSDSDTSSFQMLGAREACSSGWSQVRQQIEALEAAVYTNPGLAFDLAKALLESVCKAVLDERKCTHDDRWDLPRLFKETLDQICLVPDEIAEAERASESVRKAVGGLQAAVQGICELRNIYGFASHGKGPAFRQLDSAHALLVARAADAIVSFLFWAHRKYSDSVLHQELTYEDNAEFNEYVDENNETVCIFDLQYRPSEVLFRVDRQAYEEYLMEFKEQSETDSTGAAGGR